MSWNAGSFQTLDFPGRRTGLKMLPVEATIKVLVASAAGDLYLQSDAPVNYFHSYFPVILEWLH